MRGLALPALCLVTDRHLCGEARFLDVVAAAVEGGVNMVQLREKDLSARDLYEWGRRLRPLLAGRCLLAVNDRLDVALALRADAVQLGAGSLPVAVARQLAGRRGLLVGRSVHSVAEAQAAEREGADFLLLGTIYPSRSHPEIRAGAGPTLVAKTRTAVRLPLLAIGGIDAGRVGRVVEAGADGVAVITSIMGAPDPRAAAADLAERLRAFSPPGSEPS